MTVATRPASNPLLQVYALLVERDDRPLFSALDLSVRCGELWHVTGRNGAGKTSLLRALAGLLPVAAGQVQWCSPPCPFLYLGHAMGLAPELSVLENLKLFAALRAGACSDASLRAALDTVGLKGYGDVPCMQLSAGQKRRAALARLLIEKVPVWLLDEPFTALDVQGVALLQQMISAHLAEGGAVLLTSHQKVDVAADVLHVLELQRPPRLSIAFPEAGE